MKNTDRKKTGTKAVTPAPVRVTTVFAAAWRDAAIVQEVLAQIPWYDLIAAVKEFKRLLKELRDSLPTVEEIETELTREEGAQ